jgi:hypothetical protein
VSTIPAINFYSRISPRIFEKIQTAPMEYLGAWGTLIHEKNRNRKSRVRLPLKGLGNEADFWSFCRNWFLIDPLYYLSSCSDFGFEFAEIFTIKKWLPDSASPRLSSASWGVADSNSSSRWVNDSLTCWVGESAFECLKENSARQRVVESPSRQVGESPWWGGESLFEFFKIYHRFSELLTDKPAL